MWIRSMIGEMEAVWYWMIGEPWDVFIWEPDGPPLSMLLVGSRMELRGFDWEKWLTCRPHFEMRRPSPMLCALLFQEPVGQSGKPSKGRGSWPHRHVTRSGKKGTV